MQPLLSKEKILQSSRTYEPACGVYFLIDGDEIVYVGQAVDIHARLLSHQRSDKVFTHYHYVEHDRLGLSDLEAEYIVALSPIYNVTLPINRKWTTLAIVRRYAKEMGIGALEVKRYMRERRIHSINEYYRISDFNELLGEGWR